MSKGLKIFLWAIGIIGILAILLFFVVGPIMKKQTKKHSPEQHIVYSNNDLELKVFYCSPSKKGRKIFGELVPYGEVWRTGANEASTFTTNKDLEIDGKKLGSGTYTLWTIPNEESWDVIFNSKMYDWGVKVTDRKPSREPDHDVLVTKANVSRSITNAENFSISFTEGLGNVIMVFAWDDVVVPVEINQD